MTPTRIHPVDPESPNSPVLAGEVTLTFAPALVTCAPFASVTVTVTVKVPAELALQVIDEASELTHPVGRPAQV